MEIYQKTLVLFLFVKEYKAGLKSVSLREKCPYSDIFWSAFSHIRTEYGEIQGILYQEFDVYDVMWISIEKSYLKAIISN